LGDQVNGNASPHPAAKGFRLFSTSSNNNSNTGSGGQTTTGNGHSHPQSTTTTTTTTNGILKNYDKDTMSRVGQR
jgi:hypothetical protein